MIEKVKEILNDYFGEENVDCQPSSDNENTYTALIKFDTVIIKNEDDEMHTIRGLYVRIIIRPTGEIVGLFSIGRNIYTEAEVKAGYVHSHIPRRRSQDYLNIFDIPCLGTGPIKSSISILNKEFDENQWLLFCRQLDKYVHTESLKGGPYIRMKYIGEYNRTTSKEVHLNIDTTLFHSLKQCDINWLDFISYLIHNLNNCGLVWGIKSSGFYCIQNTEKDIIIKISNLFIHWLGDSLDRKFAESLISNNILVAAQINYNSICIAEYTNIEINLSPLCIFKGNPVNVTCIKENVDFIADNTYILNPTYISSILYNLITYINYESSRKL